MGSGGGADLDEEVEVDLDVSFLDDVGRGGGILGGAFGVVGGTLDTFEVDFARFFRLASICLSLSSKPVTGDTGRGRLERPGVIGVEGVCDGVEDIRRLDGRGEGVAALAAFALMTMAAIALCFALNRSFSISAMRAFVT